MSVTIKTCSLTTPAEKAASLSYSTLYLLRHGEIASPEILAGKTDVELSSKGWQQLVLAGETLPEISHCISSPLKRCRLFAQHFCQQKNIQLSFEDKLKEMDFGDWDGQSYQQLWQQQPQQDESSIGQFWQNPWQYQAPNGELMQEFVNRVDHWWQQWLSAQVNDRSTLGNSLVIAHGGVIKHILARVLNLPIPGSSHMSAIEVPYAGLIKISVCHDAEGKHWPKLCL